MNVHLTAGIFTLFFCLLGDQEFSACNVQCLFWWACRLRTADYISIVSFVSLDTKPILMVNMVKVWKLANYVDLIIKYQPIWSIMLIKFLLLMVELCWILPPRFCCPISHQGPGWITPGACPDRELLEVTEAVKIWHLRRLSCGFPTINMDYPQLSAAWHIMIDTYMYIYIYI